MHDTWVTLAEPRAIVWGVLAQFWVDTWYDSEQLDAFAERIAACDLSLQELDAIVRWDVCGGFAGFSLAVVATAGMALPDWYYPEEEAIVKIRHWLSRPKISSLLNPFWIAGYIASRWFISYSWSDLRVRIVRRRAHGSP
jgi:hypothetical protein